MLTSLCLQAAPIASAATITVGASSQDLAASPNASCYSLGVAYDHDCQWTGGAGVEVPEDGRLVSFSLKHGPIPLEVGPLHAGYPNIRISVLRPVAGSPGQFTEVGGTAPLLGAGGDLSETVVSSEIGGAGIDCIGSDAICTSDGQLIVKQGDHIGVQAGALTPVLDMGQTTSSAAFRDRGMSTVFQPQVGKLLFQVVEETGAAPAPSSGTGGTIPIVQSHQIPIYQSKTIKPYSAPTLKPLPRSEGIKKLLSQGGFTGQMTCTDECFYIQQAQWTLTQKFIRFMNMSRSVKLVVARSSGRIAGGTRRLLTPLTKKAKRLLRNRRVKKAKIVLRTRINDSHGTHTTKQTIKLKR
jgi:hypothetical protein